ncbi:hypothetical protein A3Q56_01376 [Intoshia linei]|uniref:Uncharacterized protein n=1 Tax=Intoshia linei TaxID=1819745 RepID=A0A177B994_9BILA|nr:hypothetical protein A3Q56_01376 [Intoshia linei]
MIHSEETTGEMIYQYVVMAVVLTCIGLCILSINNIFKGIINEKTLISLYYINIVICFFFQTMMLGILEMNAVNKNMFEVTNAAYAVIFFVLSALSKNITYILIHSIIVRCAYSWNNGWKISLRQVCFGQFMCFSVAGVLSGILYYNSSSYRSKYIIKFYNNAYITGYDSLFTTILPIFVIITTQLYYGKSMKSKTHSIQHRKVKVSNNIHITCLYIVITNIVTNTFIIIYRNVMEYVDYSNEVKNEYLIQILFFLNFLLITVFTALIPFGYKRHSSIVTATSTISDNLPPTIPNSNSTESFSDCPTYESCVDQKYYFNFEQFDM